MPIINNAEPQTGVPDVSSETSVGPASIPASTSPPTPVANADENPFAPNLQTPAAGGSQSTPSTAARFFAVTPSPRARGTPRRGRHSTLRLNRRTEGPVGHKHRHAADDVWTFYDITDSKTNDCLFCR